MGVNLPISSSALPPQLVCRPGEAVPQLQNPYLDPFQYEAFYDSTPVEQDSAGSTVGARHCLLEEPTGVDPSGSEQRVSYGRKDLWDLKCQEQSYQR